VRARQGFSVAELALASGVSRDLIEELEHGLLDPDFDLLIALADSLGVGPSTFVVRAEDLRDRPQ